MIEKLKKKALINEIDPYQLAAYLENKGYEISKKEGDVLETLKIALEATARGIKFANIDLNKSDAIKFVKSDKALYTNEDFEFGPILRQEKGNLFKDMYKKRLEKIHHIIINKQVPQKRINELKKEEERIKSQL